MPDDVAYRLRLTPVLMRGDEFGQMTIDYEASRNYVNAEGVRLMREAADEIDRLRAQVNRLEDDLTASHESHGNEVGNLSERLALAMEQRDEARRRICCDSVRLGGVYRRVGRETVQVTTPQGVAEMMGWDCFKGTDDAL